MDTANSKKPRLTANDEGGSHGSTGLDNIKLKNDDFYSLELDNGPFKINIKISKDSPSDATNMLTSADMIKARIVELKDQLNVLAQAKESVDAFLTETFEDIEKQKEEEVSDLFDTSSPLLSLGRPILSRILGFCADAESLYSCEVASYTLSDVIRTNEYWEEQACRLNHWEVYVKTSPPDSDVDSEEALNDIDFPEEFQVQRPTRFESCQVDDDTTLIIKTRLFGFKASTGRLYEKQGEGYYDYQHLSVGKDKGVDNRFNSSFFGSWLQEDGIFSIRPRVVFIRFAMYDDNTKTHRVLYQGFGLLLDDSNEYRSGLGQRRLECRIDIPIEQIDWDELQSIIAWRKNIPSIESHTRAKTEQKMKPILEDLRLTVIDQSTNNLILTTGGYANSGIFAISRRHNSSGDIEESFACIGPEFHKRYETSSQLREITTCIGFWDDKLQFRFDTKEVQR